MEMFDDIDLLGQDFDNGINNPGYPSCAPSSDFNPASLYTAPDGHIYTPEERFAILNQNPFSNQNGTLMDAGIAPLSGSFGQVLFNSQPDGTVVVTDIFGGEHTYMSLDQAYANTDILSGMPCDQFSSNQSQPVETSGEDYNPRDDYSARPFEDSKHDQIVYEEQLLIQQDAVKKYKEAMAKGDLDEAGKWEKIAIDAEYSKQAHRKFYTTYGLDARKLAGLD